MKKKPEEIRFAAYGDGPKNVALADLADALLASQKPEWAALAAGYAALASVRLREIEAGEFRVTPQFNPGRIVSSGAALDPETIRKRPCFLCRENRPPAQRAIRYGDEYLILCNPAPIFPAHWTIAHVRHLPQSISDRIEIFLRLAADFGARTILFYNGPRCGASAPDHLHFQAASAGLMPVETEILDPQKRVAMLRRDGAQISRIAGLGRGMLVVEGQREEGVATATARIMEALARGTAAEDEPMMNILCAHGAHGWRLILFPRRKQRPDIYFRKEGARRVISPAAVEMGGIMVTPREEDFLALTPELVREIYAEVAFDDAAVEELFDLL